MLWRLCRWMLTGLLAVSLIWSGWGLFRVMQSPLGGMMVARAEAELDAAYTRALSRHATPQQVSDKILQRLEETPRNWVVLEGLMALAEAEGLVLPDDLLQAYQTAHAQDHSALARASTCAACAYDLRACTMGADLACGIGVNLTVAGDLLSLGRESGAWYRGDEVDQLDVTLSFIGIGATGLVIFTGGTSYTLKAGAGMMKVAHRMGRITPGVRRLYTRAFREGVDWARVPAVRNADDLARLARSDALRPALDMTEALGTLQARAGTRGALHLVGHADSLTDAQRVARASRALGPRTVGAFEVLGKSRFLRTGLRLTQPLLDALAGLAAAFSALMGLLGNRVLRLLRGRRV